VRPRFDLIVVTDGKPALLSRLTQLGPALSERVAILLRDKQASQAELADQARGLRALTRRHAAALLISGDVELALACDADGVQLPEAKGALTALGSRAEPRASTGPDAPSPLALARARLGPARVLGASRHDLAGVLAAARDGADYATLSPVLASPGKGEPLGVAAFAAAARATSMPLFALGGVGTGQVAELAAAGAAGVAVIREVLAAPDPAHALRALRDALNVSRSS
jgi:thiamine-phosphate pyrophosphorylase